MAFVRAWYHWSVGDERLARMMLVVALSHAGCSGAAFTGELSSTSDVVDTSTLDVEAGPPEASIHFVDAMITPVHDSEVDTGDSSQSEADPPQAACILPGNTGAFYEVHSSTGCTVDRTPGDCLSASVYGCGCFRMYATEIAPECTAGWTSCTIDVDSGIVLDVTCR
jgi:hypothetical protein